MDIFIIKVYVLSTTIASTIKPKVLTCSTINHIIIITFGTIYLCIPNIIIINPQYIKAI